MNEMHEKLAQLLAFWESRRPSAGLPPRSAFLAEEFRPWMGHIGIVEVEAERPRFRVRLAGVAIVEYDGADFTGKYLDEVVPAHARRTILGPFEVCLREKAPQYDIISQPFQGATVRRLHRLLCPCAEDGERVDRILVGVYADIDNRLQQGSIYDHMRDDADLPALPFRRETARADTTG